MGKKKELEFWIIGNIKNFWIAVGIWSIYLAIKIIFQTDNSTIELIVKGLLIHYFALRILLFVLLILIGKIQSGILQNNKAVFRFADAITFSLPCSMYFYMQNELFISIGFAFSVLACCNAILCFSKYPSEECAEEIGPEMDCFTPQKQDKQILEDKREEKDELLNRIENKLLSCAQVLQFVCVILLGALATMQYLNIIYAPLHGSKLVIFWIASGILCVGGVNLFAFFSRGICQISNRILLHWETILSLSFLILSVFTVVLGVSFISHIFIFLVLSIIGVMKRANKHEKN